jgi:hypothetical protein
MPLVALVFSFSLFFFLSFLCLGLHPFVLLPWEEEFSRRSYHPSADRSLLRPVLCTNYEVPVSHPHRPTSILQSGFAFSTIFVAIKALTLHSRVLVGRAGRSGAMADRRFRCLYLPTVLTDHCNFDRQVIDQPSIYLFIYHSLVTPHRKPDLPVALWFDIQMIIKLIALNGKRVRSKDSITCATFKLSSFEIGINSG